MVFLYLGNDIKERPDPAEPFKPLFHVTNAGWIWAWDEHGNFLDPAEAYKKYVTDLSLRSRVRGLLYRTATGTLVWDLLRRMHDRATTRSWREQSPGDGEFTYTFAELAEIRSITARQGSRFLLLPIHNGGMACGRRLEDAFERAPSYADFNVLKVDLDDDRLFCAYPNCHLTNEGHARIYEAIVKWLRASPVPE